MSRHTPGPWWFEVSHPQNACAYVKAAKPGAGISIEVGALWASRDDDGAIEQRDASARLMAAAPDLLAACEAALDLISFAPKAKTERALLRAAITKATGGDK